MTMPPSAGESTTSGDSAAHVRDRRSKRLRLGWVLQHERTLQITGAVESRCQPEMAVEQRADASKAIENAAGRSDVSSCHNVIIRS